jgi:uncharacterized protein (DUF2062 family)
MEGLWPIVKPMALGSVPLGGATAILVYVFTKRFIELHKARSQASQR